MRIKFIFQILLISIIFIIISIFYYNFFYKIKAQKEEILKLSDKKAENLETQASDELKNIEYNSTDSEGNTFYINAQRALIDRSNNIENEVKMIGVTALINLRNKGTIIVYSNEALYNKLNNNTFFSGNINIEYLENRISSQNMDLIFSEKLSKIFNNVKLRSNKLELYADMVLIDMVTGNVDIEMNDKIKKVKLISRNDFNN
tara:strand:+ start:1586 stop:2194 length:609 start_codon:yes stop_codon:yes gene_type:complete